jgi:hypothetical protein
MRSIFARAVGFYTGRPPLVDVIGYAKDFIDGPNKQSRRGGFEIYLESLEWKLWATKDFGNMASVVERIITEDLEGGRCHELNNDKPLNYLEALCKMVVHVVPDLESQFAEGLERALQTGPDAPKTCFWLFNRLGDEKPLLPKLYRAVKCGPESAAVIDQCVKDNFSRYVFGSFDIDALQAEFDALKPELDLQNAALRSVECGGRKPKWESNWIRKFGDGNEHPQQEMERIAHEKIDLHLSHELAAATKKGYAVALERLGYNRRSEQEMSLK